LATELTLRPFDDDPELVEDSGGTPFWRSESCDPAFLASLPEGEPPLRRGWYLARVRLVERSGRIAGPRLYIPFPHGGFSEFRSVELKPKGGVYTGEFFVSDPASRFRFDPSFYPC